MNELFDAIRSACSPSTWSQGVELTRRLAVAGAAETEEEISLHVKIPDRVVPYSVRLYPEDAEWDCDCNSRADCCEHVAAAVIAVRKAKSAGEALPKGLTTQAKLRYVLRPHRDELALGRELVRADGTVIALKGTLASAVARKTAGVDLAPTQDDLNVDRLLPQGDAPLHRDRAWQVLKILSAAPNVEFRGKAIHISTEPLRPRARVEDALHGGFRVVVERPAGIDEVIASGIVRAGDSLHRLAETDVTGLRLERLPDEKTYDKRDTLTLVTEVLPELRRRFELVIATDRLPEIDETMRPRLELEVTQSGDELSVLPVVVYGNPPVARIDGHRLHYLGGAIPVRNQAAEARLETLARRDLGLSPGRRLSLRGEAALELAARVDAFHNQKGSSRPPLVHRTQLAPNLSTQEVGRLRFVARDTGEVLEATPEAVLRAWEGQLPLVPLLGGGFAPLPTEFIRKHEEALRTVLAARVDSGDTRPHALPALAELYSALQCPPPPDLKQAMALLEADQLPPPALPEDLTATLRPYQSTGIAWLLRMRALGLGAVLADDMGLGKTLQAICVLEAPALVVCPTSLVTNWSQELARFRPGLRVHAYQGRDRTLDEQRDVTVTSHALLRRDLETLSQTRYRTLVLDEAQAIKNPESQLAQAAFRIQADFKLSLSGTPIENRLEELWSQLHFTNPGLLGGTAEFQRRYVAPIAAGEAAAAEALRRKVRPFILRRDKKTVAPDLPPRSDWIEWCELDDGERTLYDALHEATRSEVLEKLQAGGNIMHALEALLRLRQAACHPGLVPGHGGVTSSSKLERLVTQLQAASLDGHRALVFSQWTRLLDLVEPALKEAEISFSRLDGSTRDRGEVVSRFQADDGPTVMLLSLKAGGTGLNLTAADHVFLLDLWWNPAVEAQAADRAHRIGQTRPVFVHRLVARNTVEERIVQLQERKRALADLALEDASVAAALTRDDLLELLA